MSGSYTIDKSGSGSSNFTTFKKALKMLNDSGVSGPVVFSIAKGTYNEQVLINHIKGASSVNTIEFTSKSGDSSSVIITNNYVGTDSLHGYVVRLAHASFVKINKLTLRKGSIGSSSSVYDNVLEIVGGSDSNAISNCRLIGNFSFKSSDYSSIIYSNTGIDNNNLFQNNYINLVEKVMKS